MILQTKQKIFICICCLISFFLQFSWCGATVPKTDNSNKINMVWQPIVDEVNDLSQIDKLPGVNVVSPSWFVIDSADGHIEDNSDYLYGIYVQKRGYKLWALITNDFNPEITHEWLNDKQARKYIIRQMVFYAKRYPIDGYNFDLENIYDDDKDALTNFIKEASKALHKEKLTVSIDVTVKSQTANWSSCYDRKRLAKYVDYVVLMAYDEHGRLSKTAGSVASLPWVENGIKNLLLEVPKEKIILGIPLYMRLWEEDNSGNVTAKTLSMKQAENLIKEKKAKPVWSKNAGQMYFSYKENDKTYYVWQENAKSLDLKANLVSKYDLAGIASWRKGFETEDIWQMLNEELNR